MLADTAVLNIIILKVSSYVMNSEWEDISKTKKSTVSLWDLGGFQFSCEETCLSNQAEKINWCQNTGLWRENSAAIKGLLNKL